MAPHINGKTYTEGLWEHSTEENIWTQDGGKQENNERRTMSSFKLTNSKCYQDHKINEIDKAIHAPFGGTDKKCLQSFNMKT
jgi:hypothetical protein